MNASAPALEVCGLRVNYDETPVIRGVSLSLPAGTVGALIGSNAAGKSTLLKAISGLVRPAAGTVCLNGTDVTALPPNRRARLGLCHLPDGRGIYPHLTVRENLVMQATKGDQKIAIERASQAFPVLSKRLSQKAGTLSGGEQKMVSLSRAYTRDWKVLLVDEPSLGLAPIVADEFFAFLQQIVTGRATAVLIVDQFVDRALGIATSAYLLEHGRIMMFGNVQEVQQRGAFPEPIGGP